jgi:hypothetical protein
MLITLLMLALIVGMALGVLVMGVLVGGEQVDCLTDLDGLDWRTNRRAHPAPRPRGRRVRR